ncbi:reverse transcriptase [Gossypium australe]|uniref:Reverse transcriptase n=1 Tax=Gossypium australe TaxID=47621 RepID=A0A5B6X0J6_9ROSI|nr:reverse transcriptase [Gossypium australe]
MDDFRKTLEDFSLVDKGYSRAWFTWEMGNLLDTNIRERLDRSVANTDWMNLEEELYLALKVLTAWESLVKRTNLKGYLALKLDMSKTYDHVEWGFLRRIMLKKIFDARLIDLIIRCIFTTSYKVIMNDEEEEVFHRSRGLSQGDPLSLYLSFVL